MLQYITAMANNQYIVVYNYSNTIYCGKMFLEKEILIILSEQMMSIRRREYEETEYFCPFCLRRIS